MHRRFASVTLIVDDYGKAIAYFVDILGFTLRQIVPRDDGDRWVVVTPGGCGTGLRLAKAADGRQMASMGAQAGGRVFLVLHTDDLARDHAEYARRGVTFLEEPRQEPYGLVAVFADIFGNRWDLIQPGAAVA